MGIFACVCMVSGTKRRNVRPLQAYFVLHPDDVKAVKEVLEAKDEDFLEYRRYKFKSYLVERIRRQVPRGRVLAARLGAVLRLFQSAESHLSPEQRTMTPKNEAAMKAMIRAARSGALSDPPGVQLWRYKRNKDGSIKRDGDGLPLYCSIRGSGGAELSHQKLIYSFRTFSRLAPDFAALLLQVRHAALAVRLYWWVGWVGWLSGWSFGDWT